MTPITGPVVTAADVSAADTATAAANAAVTKTRAGVAGKRWVLGQVDFSYSAAPTNGELTVSDGATVVRRYKVTAAGPGPIRFHPPLRFGAGSNLVVALSAGGSGVVGAVNDTAWLE